MEVSKIRLSDAERKLITDAEMILTKNRILQKTAALLGDVQDMLIQAPAPVDFKAASPKISKGENYLGLPYLILDYPRLANGHDLLFIRSMFWWGNFFSSTLHLAGSYKKKYENRIIAAYDSLALNNYFVGINEDPWVHHFEAANYKQVQQLSPSAFAAIIESQPHIKIAARWPLSEWDLAATTLSHSWQFLIKLIS